MSYTADQTSELIEELSRICDAREEWLFQLVWPGKGNTPSFPWPDMSLNLCFNDETLQSFEILDFTKQLPETRAKVSLTGDGFYNTISRSDLEIVLKDFITTYGTAYEVH